MPESVQAESIVAAVSIAVDQVTSEVVTALRHDGISPILLKGPSIARWLYPSGGRYYGDSDLLVDPQDFTRAVRTLLRLGFGEPAHALVDHAHTYRRPTNGGYALCVDLHRTLPYVTATPEQAWPLFSDGTERLVVGNAEVDILGIPQRLLHIAMHALQHAFEALGPLEDMRRAIGAASIEQWSKTAKISRALGAEDALAAGLCLIPEGQALSESLSLTLHRRGIVRLAATTQREVSAYQLQRLLDAATLRERVLLLVNPIFVSPTVLRQVSPLARRGRLGLGLAYATRPFRLVRRIGPAVAERRRILRSR